MTKGVHFIGGKEFLLAGRHWDKQTAIDAAVIRTRDWEIVKVRKTPKARMGQWSVWVHGAR